MRVLVVEDDRALARALVRVLELNDHEVEHVATLKDCLMTMQDGPEAIILDLGLPDSGGINTAQVVKKLLPPETVLIVYSADDTVYEQVLGLEVDNFLVKGEFTPIDIPAAIKMAIANKRMSHALRRHHALLNGGEATNPGVFMDTDKIADRMLLLARDLKMVVESG